MLDRIHLQEELKSHNEEKNSYEKSKEPKIRVIYWVPLFLASCSFATLGYMLGGTLEAKRSRKSIEAIINESEYKRRQSLEFLTIRRNRAMRLMDSASNALIEAHTAMSQWQRDYDDYLRLYAAPYIPDKIQETNRIHQPIGDK